MNILITGVTGFVGSGLVAYFSDKPEVKLFGHTRNTAAAATKFKNYKLELIHECTTDQLNRHNIDCIIHLAGIAHDLSNKYVAEDYYKVNFEDTALLYKSFTASNARTFVYFSSIKAAVDAITKPLDEHVVPNPVTHYGKSKLKAEEFITTNAVTGKQFYLVRPCMIHGAGNKGNLNLLYKFVKRGIPYPLGAFENQRSFLCADNLNYLLHELLLKQPQSGVYNFSDNGTLSTTSVVRIIASALEKKYIIAKLPVPLIKFLFKIAGKRDVLNKLTGNMEVSNRKVISALGAKLPFTIEEGLRKTIKSFND